MSGWALATEVAIWTLILGSAAVFGWFLAEVARLARRRDRPSADRGEPDDPAQ
ncbi:MAG: hypothetical protein KY466_08455 [Gemmatimonadetes bacterium]|nr:hypothetical protein [Gemmatimonadota bacterium]